ncbi:MAG: hypothetical protein A3K19_30690 [Lentisphaerae bacterium RIFOXYB12_FULL_65_16]|nr:MAG: hypothetical protein A3K18_01080 [Lentisphaerae bacterium RIFOXYA12_64_32]OGV88786.1 MAG: hypothetical protein A3K19_30690 [Lentisphaerae bacterium RIFOXYB12_FULL_65_16]
MDKVKVAMIGAGALANAMHYPSLAEFADAEIVGICDLNPERLKTTAEKFKVANTFNNYQQMLEKTAPDAVYALMPPHVLFDVAMDVMDRGHNLFVEKPPAITTFQTRCLAKKAEDKGLVTAVGFQRRYHPLVRRCYDEVKKVNQPHQVVGHFLKYMEPGANYPYYRGAVDILTSDAIHAADSIRYYCGLANVKKVASDVRNLDSWYPMSFNALIYFDNDAVGILHANWRTGKRSLKFEFHAAGASSYIDADGVGEVWVKDGKTPVFQKSNVEFAGSDKAYANQGFREENRAFIDAVKSKTQLHNNLQDAVKSMELVDLIYANAINK